MLKKPATLLLKSREVGRMPKQRRKILQISEEISWVVTGTGLRWIKRIKEAIKYKTKTKKEQKTPQH